MRLMRETDERFVNIEKKTGLFVLLAIAGLVFVFVFIGLGRDAFTRKASVFFVADSGKDMAEGMPVKLSGFRIGKLKRLSLDDIAKVSVELSINNKHMKWLRADSKARLIKEGLIGESVIEITAGSPSASGIGEGGTIAFEREKDINEMVGELKTGVDSALTDIRRITGYIADPEGDIRKTFGNLDRLSDEFLRTRKHLDALLLDTDRDISTTLGKVNAFVNSADRTVADAHSAVGKLDRELPALLEKADKSLQNIQSASGDLKKLTSEAGPEISSLLDSGGELAEGAKEVIDSAKQVWPIRSHIKEGPEKETVIEVDSYE